MKLRKFFSLSVALILPAAVWALQVPVSMSGMRFVPDTLTVTQGDSVVWTNTEALPHTTTSGAPGVPDGLWDSPTLSQGGTYVHGFDSTGTFPYFCRFHYLSGMTARITVRSAGILEGPGRKPLSPMLSATPNPFSDRIVFSYRLEHEGASAIEIFDMLGGLVRSLTTESEPGEFQAFWDGKSADGLNADRGAYVVRLGTGAGTISTRIVKLD